MGHCERYVYVVYYAGESLTSMGRILADRTRTDASGGRCATTDEKTYSFFREIGTDKVIDRFARNENQRIYFILYVNVYILFIFDF